MDWLQQMQKIEFLMESERHGQALELLSQLRASDPDNPHIHAKIALCLESMDRLPEAIQEIKRALSQAPEYAPYHYYYAHFLYQDDHYREALAAVDTALALDSEEPAYHTMKSNIFASMKKWHEARDAALSALTLDPESDGAHIALGYALQQLGEEEGASEAMLKALENNPDNEYTLAAQGQILLRQKQYKQAMVFFKESLRINPQCQQARYGMVTSLKARNPFYRLLLQFNLWLSKFDSRMVTAAIIGAYFLVRFLRNLAEENPGLKTIVTPILVAYFAIVAYMWFSDPIANFFLRLNKDAKYLLTDLERQGAVWVGLWFCSAILAVVLGFALGQSLFFTLAAAFACLILPFHEAYRDERPFRYFYLAFSFFLVGMVVLAVALFFNNSPFRWWPAAIFFVTFFVFQWVVVLRQAKHA